MATKQEHPVAVVAEEADDPDLTCAVCHCTPLGSILQCPNGHIICGDELPPHPPGAPETVVNSLQGYCLAKLKKSRGVHKGCPTCRAEFPGVPLRCLVGEKMRDKFIARQLLPQLACPYPNCAKQVTLDRMQTHMGACAFRPGAVLSALENRTGVVHRACGVLTELVKAGADTNEVCKLRGLSALILACANRDVAALTVMLAAERTEVNGVCRKRGRTALFYSAALEDVASVKLLLSRSDVDIHKPDKCNLTPFFHVACRGPALLKRKEIMQLLLQAGADVNGVCGSMNRTVLFHAASVGDTCLMNWLLAVPGIDVNKKDSRGVTPVMGAAGRHERLYVGGDDVRLLVAAGADINTVPLTLVYAMLDCSARHGWPGAESVQVLLSAQGVNVNHRNKYGNTLMFSAASEGYLEVLKQLVGSGGGGAASLVGVRGAGQIAADNGHDLCWQFLDDAVAADIAATAAEAAANEAPRVAANVAAAAAVVTRRAASRSLDTVPQADMWSARGGDYHERITLPATAALEQASKLLAPAIVARETLRSPAAFEGFAHAEESDSDDESNDGTGGRNGEDSDSDSYSDNNSDNDSDMDAGPEDAHELNERVYGHSVPANVSESAVEDARADWLPAAVVQRPIDDGRGGRTQRRKVQRV